jgi:hypothetical protein
MPRRGRCFTLFTGTLVGPQLQVRQLSHAVFFYRHLGMGWQKNTSVNREKHLQAFSHPTNH